jgi:Tfp pilus assembly protein PilF
MSTSPAPALPEPRRRSSSTLWLIGAFAFLLVLLTAFITWLVWRTKSQADQVAAAHANALGVGFMEQFDFARAAAAFEEAGRLAPTWTPAKINLGIALLNESSTDVKTGQEKLGRASAIFREVLASDADNPYAHYCLGIIYYYRGQLTEALPHFEAVTRADPNDAHAWYFQGMSLKDSGVSHESLDCFEKALKLNPYLKAGLLAVANHVLTADDPKKKDDLLEQFKRLQADEAFDRLDIKYSEMGRYAEVIGKSPAPSPAAGKVPLFEPAKDLNVILAPGTTWASGAELDELHRAVRGRFGGTIILLDYNGDGRTDVLLLSAVVQAGVVQDLLLRNDGGNKFTDVTLEAGLANHPGSLGGAVGDFDNDGRPDLALTGPYGVKLFHNKDGKLFEDKSSAAGFDKHPGVFLTATWVDIDQDGDLDLVAAKYAETKDLALRLLNGEAVDGKGQVHVFLNVGIPPTTKPDDLHKPLSIAFKPATGPETLLVKGPVTGVIATDVDGDKDLDLIVLLDGLPPVTVLNDRMLRFHRADSVTPTSGSWNGGLVLDANGDDQSDLVLLDPSVQPRFLVSKTDEPTETIGARFTSGLTDSPPLCSACWVDLDLDGYTDLVGLSYDRKPVYLQGDGKGKFTKRLSTFGPAADAIKDLLAVIPSDLSGEGNPDLLCWSEVGGLRLFKNLGNGNRSLRVSLTGMRKAAGHPLRTNADGVGCWVRINSGPITSAVENTTLAAGLGQSRTPLQFGIGRFDMADAVRMRWPDAMIQAEVNQAAGLVNIVETSRKVDSCPVIFTWDGFRFAYVTDCLGAGSMGELEADGSTRPPRPEESVKLEAGKFVPKDGKYVLKIGEPMDEVLYLDHLRLDVIDQPAGLSVFPDERFATSGPQPTQERLFFRDAERVFPVKAIDHQGKDVTAVLRERDGKMVDDFAVRSWLGFAEDHFVELDFGERLKSLPPGRKVYLVLAGWTDYPYPESIFAATQAGVATVWPVLEQKQRDGTWKNLGEIGLPAGLPRVMTSEVTGLLDPTGGPVRIRSNLQIFWDQIFLAPLADVGEKLVKELPVTRASLEHRGFAQEFSPNGRLPVAYDHSRVESVPYTKWRGKLTRLGDVTELLTGLDDHFVICGPGDEITVEFEANALPPPKAGWERSFILRTWGYCKDTALATATSGCIGPLPYRAMSNYPYDPAKEPLPKHVKDYDLKWNTRSAGGR